MSFDPHIGESQARITGLYQECGDVFNRLVEEMNKGDEASVSRQAEYVRLAAETLNIPKDSYIESAKILLKVDREGKARTIKEFKEAIGVCYDAQIGLKEKETELAATVSQLFKKTSSSKEEK